MGNSKSGRIAFIDIAKAIGIIIVLINHAELSLGALTYLGGMFYMPVFFVLSGYTYKYKNESFTSFALKKAKRLLLPYFVYQLVLTGLFGIKDLLLGLMNNSGFNIMHYLNSLIGVLYSRNSLYPEYVTDKNVYFFKSLNAPLWFLTGLFVSLILYRALEELSIRADKRLLNAAVIICVTAGELLSLFCPVLLPWSIDTAFISVGFIHIGRLLRDREVCERVYGSPKLIFCIFTLFTVLSYINGNVNMSVREYGRSGILYVVIGSLGSMLCILASMLIERHLKHTADLLSCIGKNTVGILALHLLVFYTADILFVYLNITNSTVVNAIILEKIIKIVLAVAILLPFEILLNKLRVRISEGKAVSPNEK